MKVFLIHYFSLIDSGRRPLNDSHMQAFFRTFDIVCQSVELGLAMAFLRPPDAAHGQERPAANPSCRVAA
jgi:hypothetical protein